MKDIKLTAVGQPLQRKEDIRLMKGEGRFSDDQCSPDQVWAWMVRSPHPHAKIVRIDKSAALKMPGVLGVFTGADCLAACGQGTVRGRSRGDGGRQHP